MAFNLKKVLDKYNKLKVNLPKQIANEGQKFYLKNFNEQQWNGVPWAQRRNKKNLRKLLVRTEQLRRAVSNSRREISFNRIRFEVFVQSKKGFNYGVVHNEGGTVEKEARKGVINFRIYKNGKSRFAKLKNANFQQDAIFKEHKIVIPRRKFLGFNKTLDSIIRKKIDDEVAKCFK